MKPSSIIPGTATATLLLAATLTAQSIRTWDGDAATSSFLDAANWSDDTVPVAGDTARWNGNAGGNLSLTFNANLGGTSGFLMRITGSQAGSITLTNDSGVSRDIRFADNASAFIMDVPIVPPPVPEPAIPVISNPGQMVATLEELSSSHSPVFLLGDEDRPGAWCWFQDERAIVDETNPGAPVLLTGVVTYGPTGSDKRGDVDLYWLQLNSVTGGGPLVRGRFELDDQLQMDDHAAPAFMIRPDGRYLVTWSKHGLDLLVRSRVSTNPGDPTSWMPTRTTSDTGGGVTYTNPNFLAEANNGAGVVFNGIRSQGFDSNFILSDDLGETWRYGGRVLDALDPWPTDPDGGRAYVKYAGDGKTKVHIFSTDDHPKVNFNEDRTAPGDLLNSIYYGYIENNQLHRNDGHVVDEDLSNAAAVPPTLLTTLLKDGTVVAGAAMRRGWQTCLSADDAGEPVGIFQFRADDNPDDHRYFYARRSQGEWLVSFLAYGGDYFGSSAQLDYTGLAAVDPANPDVVFISTSSDPVTNAPLISSATGLRQNEIFMGKTSNGGSSWTWVAVTKNSATDNLRPIVPRWTAGKSVVLWMQGNYPSFYTYSTEIVGQVIVH
jgi:hypothetical protein